MAQCQGTTIKGARCRRSAAPGSDHCDKHKDRPEPANRARIPLSTMKPGTIEEAESILGGDLGEVTYFAKLEAYKLLRKLWTIDECMYACQMEVELHTGEGEGGKRQMWMRELNALHKAKLQKEIELGKVTVSAAVIVPQGRDA